jgi:hypothetical protein
MLKGSCHCGAVSVEIPTPPTTATLCNCSICRRLGAIWAYYLVSHVRISGHPQATDGYIWGDRTLRTVRCATCGCATHWEPLTVKPDSKMGVNLRNFDPAALEGLTLRRFDGAVSWKFVD